MVFNNKYFEVYCEKCGNIYTNTNAKWCKPCQLNELSKIINRTSGNEEIDDLIQKMQSKIENKHDKIFEWIPCNQFNNIEEIVNNEFVKVYSAIWEGGPLIYNDSKYVRKQGKKVALKCIYNSQNITNEFLNEV